MSHTSMAVKNRQSYVLPRDIDKYCRSGNFRVFSFSQICNFGTFREVLNSRNYNFADINAIIIIIFARFLNLRICPPIENREK